MDNTNVREYFWVWKQPSGYEILTIAATKADCLRYAVGQDLDLAGEPVLVKFVEAIKDHVQQ